jgi:hypothetical protein
LTGTLALTASDTNSITMNAIGASVDVLGTGDVTLNSTGLTGETVTNSKTAGTLTVVSSATTSQDVSKVAADLIQFTGNVGGVTDVLTVANGAALELTAATAATDITVTGTGTSDAVTLTVSGTAPTQTALTLSGVETLNLVANATAGTGVDLTVTTLDTDGGKVVVTGTNDIDLGNITAAGEVDASALVGDATLTQTGATALTLTGSATGTNIATFTNTAAASNYVGGAGADTVAFATVGTAGVGTATAVVGEGVNTITAAALTTGDLVVVGGSGVDTVTAGALTTANVTLELGDGANVVSVGGTLAGANITVVTGSGADAVTVSSASNAGDTYALTLGSGSDTLNISTANNVGTWAVSGLETIAIGSANAAAIVDATLVSGKSYAVTGDGSVGDLFSITTATAGSYDFSDLVINQTITKGLGGITVVGNAGNDTIVGTDYADTLASNGGTDTITGGLGVDTYTGGAGVDTFVIASADTGKTSATADIINVASFTSTTDKLSLGVAGTATNFAAASADGGATDALGVAAAIIAADAAMDGTVKYYFYDNTNAGADNGYLVIDADMDGTSDDVLIITGALTSADIVFGDIIA